MPEQLVELSTTTRSTRWGYLVEGLDIATGCPSREAAERYASEAIGFTLGDRR
jgi:hypothetical protein